MRSPRLINVAAAAAAALAVGSAVGRPRALDDHDLKLLDRVSWGVSAPAAAELAALGPRRWLDRQLHPDPNARLPEAAQAQIEALPISRVPMVELVTRMEAQFHVADPTGDPELKKAAERAYQLGMNELARQAVSRGLLRDLYSPNQLQEQMTWFWTNQFSLYQQKRDIRAMLADWEERSIRPRALGRFRELLEATLRHPAMVRYLDNDQNAVGHVNENYARELMELHTMGVGSGYTQKDVQELARILTGVGVNLSPARPQLRPGQERLYLRDGLFEFNPARHDFGDKLFLGHAIRGSGFAEVEQALDILVRQPATARHVSQRLATFFVGDAPPPALVGRMAAAFQRSDGDIAATLSTLFASPEFDASLGKAFKDPRHYVVSAVRLAYGDRVVVNTQPLQGWLARLGASPYERQTPDGYPLEAAAWSGPGQMAGRFEIAHYIGSGASDLFKPPGAAWAAPAPIQAQAALYAVGGGAGLAPPTRAALAQASSPQQWAQLFLSSPEFMRR